MTALLSVLVQLASVAAGLYLGLHGQIWNGLAVFFAVQALHWLAEKVTLRLIEWHDRHFLGPGWRLTIELQHATGIGNRTPPAWARIATAVGLTYFGLSCFVIWFALSH